MKISENISINTGNVTTNNIHTDKTDTKRSGAVFAGNLNSDFLQDRIQQRKKEAQEKAMKVISDAFDGDREIDEDLQTRREHVKELKHENKELKERLSEIADEKEVLREQYGITEDACGTEVSAEYQMRLEELDNEQEACQENLDDNTGLILEENAIVRATRLERLKYSPMEDAREQAEEILESASSEIISMVVEDAKSHMDRAAEEREEQADKIEAEREEQEAFIEKQQEKNREQEEVLEDMPTRELIEMEQIKTDVQKEVKNIIDKMKLVAEDIKGAAVDSTV